MAEYGFPGTAAHLTEHDKFTQVVAKFLADHRAGKPGVPVSHKAVTASSGHSGGSFRTVRLAALNLRAGHLRLSS